MSGPELRTLTVNQQANGSPSPYYTQLASDSRSVSPNSFNQPASITVGGTMVYQYAYDDQHQRAIETDLKTGSVTNIARWGVGYSETTVNSDNTVDTSDYTRIVPFKDSGSSCRNGASACTSILTPDPTQGKPIFEWHPHPLNLPGSDLPSEADLN